MGSPIAPGSDTVSERVCPARYSISDRSSYDSTDYACEIGVTPHANQPHQAILEYTEDPYLFASVIWWDTPVPHVDFSEKRDAS